MPPGICSSYFTLTGSAHPKPHFFLISSGTLWIAKVLSTGINFASRFSLAILLHQFELIFIGWQVHNWLVFRLTTVQHLENSTCKTHSGENIARGTTDPGIASITWIISPATKQANSLERKIQVKHSIGSNFGQMTLPALVLNLPTRWRHLKIQIEHSIGSNFGH